MKSVLLSAAEGAQTSCRMLRGQTHCVTTSGHQDLSGSFRHKQSTHLSAGKPDCVLSREEVEVEVREITFIRVKAVLFSGIIFKVIEL